MLAGQAFLGNGDDGDGGHDQEQVGDPHQQLIEPGAEVAGNGPHRNTDHDSDTYTDPNSNSHTYPDSHPYAYAYANACPDTDTDTNPNSYSHTYTDSCSDSDAYGNSYTHSEHITHRCRRKRNDRGPARWSK